MFETCRMTCPPEVLNVVVTLSQNNAADRLSRCPLCHRRAFISLLIASELKQLTTQGAQFSTSSLMNAAHKGPTTPAQRLKIEEQTDAICT